MFYFPLSAFDRLDCHLQMSQDDIQLMKLYNQRLLEISDSKVK